MERIYDNFTAWLLNMGVSEANSLLILRIGIIAVIFLIIFILNKICWKAVIPAIRKITAKTEAKWDDYIFSYPVLKNLCRLIAPIVVYVAVPYLMLNEATQVVILKICSIYITIVCMMLICAVISSLYSVSNEHAKTKGHSLKGFYQMLKLIVICIGSIIIISNLLGKNPTAILTGLGAGTAILMLVFQDTIKGFVAGIQLTANDMLRPGDWITMPKNGVDGDVLEVTLTTVKVQNWDKTIVTVPPYALVNDSFQNWRGMFDIGGRRIKRSINIDMNTVRFCTAEELAEFKKQPWMEGFEETGKEEVNLYIFRHYVEQYLRSHPKVSKDLIMMVRQLQPTAQGMPIELYFFSADTRWVKYEQLQAEVFDHILAMVHTFGLRVFQSPTGQDFQSISQA